MHSPLNSFGYWTLNKYYYYYYYYGKAHKVSVIEPALQTNRGYHSTYLEMGKLMLNLSLVKLRVSVVSLFACMCMTQRSYDLDMGNYSKLI